MTGGPYDYDDVVLHIDSGASKHFTSDVGLFTSWNLGAKNVTFNTATGTTIASYAVGTLKLKAYDDNRKHRIVTLRGACYAPHQPHNLVAAGQFTQNSQEQLESPDVKSCAWQINLKLFLSMSTMSTMSIQPTEIISVVTTRGNMWMVLWRNCHLLYPCPRHANGQY